MNSELYQRVASKMGAPALQLIGTDQKTQTFFGGEPLSSIPFEWPRKDGRPLSFMGQLDLSELELRDAAPWLPGIGRLLFFYDLVEFPWGFDPKDKGGCAVIHDDGSGPVQRISFPGDLEKNYRLPKIKYLKGRPYLSIPSLERVGINEAGITKEEQDDYYGLSIECFDKNLPCRNLLVTSRKNV